MKLLLLIYLVSFLSGCTARLVLIAETEDAVRGEQSYSRKQLEVSNNEGSSIFDDYKLPSSNSNNTTPELPNNDPNGL